MPNTRIDNQVTRYMLLKNHVFGHTAPRLDWNLIKQRAQRAGVDTSRFNKKLGPALDALVKTLISAKATLATPGAELGEATKNSMQKQYETVKKIAEDYLAVVGADLDKPGLPDAQRDALESMKRKLRYIIDEYGRISAARAR